MAAKFPSFLKLWIGRALESVRNRLATADSTPIDPRARLRLQRELVLLPAGFVLGMHAPVMIFLLGHLYPAAYDGIVLPFLHLNVLPVMPLLCLGLVAAVILALDRRRIGPAAIAACGIGLAMGTSLLLDWWYCIPGTVGFLLVLAIWFARRMFWANALVSVVIVSALVMLMAGACVLNFSTWEPQRDLRFSTSLPAWHVATLVAFLLVTVLLLAFWAIDILRRGDRRNRAQLVDLISREPRCEHFFDMVLSLSRVSGGSPVEGWPRLPAAAAVKEEGVRKTTTRVWTKSDRRLVPLYMGLGWRIGYRLATFRLVREGIRFLRPARTDTKLDSSALLDLINEGSKREENAYLNGLFALPTANNHANETPGDAWQLVKISGHDEAPDRIEIREDPVVIGRVEGVDCVINLASISRRHCTLEKARGGLRVTDHDATNGTFIGSEKISRGILRDGDLLKLGDVEYFLRCDLGRTALEQCLNRAVSVNRLVMTNADAHFARHVLLEEALIEASSLFGVTVEELDTDGLEEKIATWLLAIKKDSRESSVSIERSQWLHAARNYQELWIENIDRLVATRGLECMNRDENDPISFEVLTRNLLTCRVASAKSLSASEHAAANLGLCLFLVEYRKAKAIISDLEKYFEKECEASLRGKSNGASERLWSEVSLACFAFLFWHGRHNDWKGGSLQYTYLEGVARDGIGKKGLAHAKAMIALEDALRYEENGGQREEVSFHVQGAVAAYGRLEPRGVGELLKLTFVANLIRLLPEIDAEDENEHAA